MGAKATKRYVKGKQLSCPICKYTQFLSRRTLLNTKSLTLFGLDWANREATNYICDNCGYIMWFMLPVTHKTGRLS